MNLSMNCNVKSLICKATSIPLFNVHICGLVRYMCVHLVNHHEIILVHPFIYTSISIISSKQVYIVSPLTQIIEIFTNKGIV